eukprot:TRINITY_DN9289_c0_g1_i2.p1 TRINITY_DN9289_c0_g1~~TRINITY_DN9289_c0_g1_i2.p1  ORF type:complete len:139 (+),score=13.51 TRINITY_DN9289_c0_g1_i2:141-557(+)
MTRKWRNCRCRSCTAGGRRQPRASVESCPTLSFLAKLCLKCGDVQEAFVLAAQKLCSEFGEQATPLLEVIQENPEVGKKFSELASTGSADHPCMWLKQELAQAYFEPHICECNRTDGSFKLGWRLVPNMYGQMLAFAI